jgi:hypothetical protein
MAGAHMDREGRYNRDQLSPVQRDNLILKLKDAGWSQTQIGTYLGMTQAGISHALKRLQGIPRIRSRYRFCGGPCGDNFRIDQLNTEGLCSKCAKAAE